MDFALETINKQIESVLSGDGSFDDLKRLQSEKADIESRAYLDTVRALQTEISDLKAHQVGNHHSVAELEIDRQLLAAQMNKLSLEMETLRENYSECNGKIYLANSAIDTARKTINEKKAELNTLIQNKLAEQI